MKGNDPFKDRFRHTLALALVGVMSCACGIAQSRDSKAPTFEVHVVGKGSSLWEARTDAVRQSLQQSMRQLVIADRVVVNDELLRDSVLSTMNGYVDSFRTLREFREGADICIEATVVVSQARIENYLAGTIGASARVKGEALAANLQAEVLSRSARAEIFWRLLADYPTQALDVAIQSVTVDERSASNIVVSYAVSANKDFLASVREGIKSMSVEVGPKRRFKTLLTQAFVNKPESGRALDISSQLCISATRSYDYNLRAKVELNSTDGPYECSNLPRGSYRKVYTGGRLDKTIVETLALGVDFLDSNSESILVGGAIKIVTGRTLLTISLPESSSVGTGPRNEAPLAVYLNTSKAANGEFSVSTTSIKDMSRLARVVVIPVAVGKEHEDYLCPGQPLLNMLACGTWADVAQELKYRASLDSGIDSSEKKK